MLEDGIDHGGSAADVGTRTEMAAQHFPDGAASLPASRPTKPAEEWWVTWRVGLTSATGVRTTVLYSMVHDTGLQAQTAALQVAASAIGGELRLSRRAGNGSVEEVVTSAGAIAEWRISEGGLPRSVESRWCADDRRAARRLRLYCAFRDLFAEASAAGAMGRRECRDLRAIVRAALIPSP